MTKSDKLIARFKRQPKDFTWNELTTLLTRLGFDVLQGSGSRVKFYHGGVDCLIQLHKPHPANILKAYLVHEVLRVLSEEGANMTVLNYKGFLGSIEADPVAKCLHGKLLYITDLVTYEAETVAKLEKEFKSAVDDYLATCKKLYREPMKPFKGSLNVRIGPELHKDAAMHAAMEGMTLNEYIKTALENQIRVAIK